MTGNVYLRARYLNPGLGRFLSSDSVQPNAPGTQGYHRYSYVANNPTTWVDPTGHEVEWRGGRTLHPFWYAIALGIAYFYVGMACAGVGPACASPLFALATFVIIALIMVACALGGFDWACYTPVTVPWPADGMSPWWEADPPASSGRPPLLWYLIVSIPEVAFGPPGDRGGGRGRGPGGDHPGWDKIRRIGEKVGKKCYRVGDFIYMLDTSQAHFRQHVEVWSARGQNPYRGIVKREGGKLEVDQRRIKQGRDMKRSCGVG